MAPRSRLQNFPEMSQEPSRKEWSEMVELAVPLTAYRSDPRRDRARIGGQDEVVAAPFCSASAEQTSRRGRRADIAATDTVVSKVMTLRADATTAPKALPWRLPA